MLCVDPVGAECGRSCRDPGTSPLPFYTQSRYPPPVRFTTPLSPSVVFLDVVGTTYPAWVEKDEDRKRYGEGCLGSVCLHLGNGSPRVDCSQPNLRSGQFPPPIVLVSLGNRDTDVCVDRRPVQGLRGPWGSRRWGDTRTESDKE